MRSCKGTSLIEMLSALFITSFIGVVMCEIAVTQNVVAFKTNNKIDSLIAAKRFFPQLEREIHMARSFVYSTAPIFSCTPTDLYLTVPNKFDADGAPTVSAAGWGWAVALVHYSIIKDINRPGQYQLRRTELVNGVDTNPTIILSGIVGPDATETASPQVFKYFYSNPSTYSFGPTLLSPSSSAQNSPQNTADNSQIVGVRVTLEVTGDLSARAELNSRSFAFASDLFTRSNSSAP